MRFSQPGTMRMGALALSVSVDKRAAVAQNAERSGKLRSGGCRQSVVDVLRMRAFPLTGMLRSRTPHSSTSPEGGPGQRPEQSRDPSQRQGWELAVVQEAAALQGVQALQQRLQ